MLRSFPIKFVMKPSENVISSHKDVLTAIALPFIAMLRVPLLGVILLTNVCLLKADYLLQYQVEHYFNIPHTRSGGFCCDLDCSNECENRFLFCLRPVGFNRSSEECPLGNYSTGVIANDSVVFAAGEDLDVGVPNPLVFNGAGAWPGQVEMYVRVDDDDDDGTSDLVTRFYIEISATAGLEFTSTQEYGEDSVGLLGASYRVSCTEDFYSPDCSVFCRVRDDAQDHYTCDGQGNRVCLSGFEDPASNCTEPCTPTEGCSLIGGYCNVSGTCICKNGYSGDNCSIDLDPCAHTTPCQNGGTCMTTGPDQCECQCVEGYEGMNCELMVTDECSPNPCLNGGTCVDLFLDYVCDCAAGYEGKNCSPEPDKCVPNPCMNGGTCTIYWQTSAAPVPLTLLAGTVKRGKRTLGWIPRRTLIGAAVAAGILLVAIVVLLALLILVLKWRGHSQRKVAISAQHARPIAAEVFRADNPTYGGDISLLSLSGGDKNSGSLANHKFRNPQYGSKEAEGFKSGVSSPFKSPYYATVARSPSVEPHPHDPAQVPAMEHQYDSVKVGGAEHQYDQAEGIKVGGTEHQYDQAEGIKVGGAEHHYDDVEEIKVGGAEHQYNYSTTPHIQIEKVGRS